MPPTKYVGRAPNSDSSVVTKGYIDSTHTQVEVTPDYIADAVSSYVASINLVTPAYIDSADATRSSKAEVDAADLNYLPTTARGAVNGVASLNASGLIPSAQLPTLSTDRPILCVDGTISLSTEQTVTGTTAKTLQAGTLTITDPGYAYRVLAFAFVGGRCAGTIDHSRRKGGGSMGKMTILDGNDALYSGGVAAGALGLTVYPVVPTAAQGTLPSTVTGSTTLKLWVALQSGTSYIFSPTGTRFLALVLPAL
jgi:hypothetical protein